MIALDLPKAPQTIRLRARSVRVQLIVDVAMDVVLNEFGERAIAEIKHVAAAHAEQIVPAFASRYWLDRPLTRPHLSQSRQFPVLAEVKRCKCLLVAKPSPATLSRLHMGSKARRTDRG